MNHIDEKDRKIINILQRNAGATNAQIGTEVGISGPAVHERIKRLRADSVILGSHILVDPVKIGRDFLSFVLIKSRGPGKSEQVDKLGLIPEIEEIHSIAGPYSILIKVRTESPPQMEQIYERIYGIPGIEGSESIIAFKTYIDRPTHLPLSVVSDT